MEFKGDNFIYIHSLSRRNVSLWWTFLSCFEASTDKFNISWHGRILCWCCNVMYAKNLQLLTKRLKMDILIEILIGCLQHGLSSTIVYCALHQTQGAKILCTCMSDRHIKQRLYVHLYRQLMNLLQYKQSCNFKL